MITLKDLAVLARHQMEAQQLVEEREAKLQAAKAALRELEEETIPEAMEEIGLDKVVTADGLEVEVVAVTRASIPKANTAKALAWLRKHGFGKLIKSELIVVPGDEDERTELLEVLDGRQVAAKEGVHAQTLGAWVREQLEEGRNVPEKLFGVYRQRKSKITVKE